MKNNTEERREQSLKWMQFFCEGFQSGEVHGVQPGSGIAGSMDLDPQHGVELHCEAEAEEALRAGFFHSC